MLKCLNRIFTTLWLVMLGCQCWAQPKKLLPTSIQVSGNIYSPLYYKFFDKSNQPTTEQYEFSTLIEFNRLILVGDYGWGYVKREKLNKETKTKSSCCNQGKYFRTGFNYNFIKHSIDHNVAFLGLRYANSYFQDIIATPLIHERTNPLLQSKITSHQKNLKAQWFELVAGIQIKVCKWLYIGSTIRYKFGKKISKRTVHIPFDLIGWGLNEEYALGLHYYIALRFPLQKNSLLQQPGKEQR